MQNSRAQNQVECRVGKSCVLAVPLQETGAISYAKLGRPARCISNRDLGNIDPHGIFSAGACSRSSLVAMSARVIQEDSTGGVPFDPSADHLVHLASHGV